MTTTEIIAEAGVKADRINDLLKEGIRLPTGECLTVRSEAYREHNRLSWAAQDLETLNMEGWQSLTEQAYQVLK